MRRKYGTNAEKYRTGSFHEFGGAISLLPRELVPNGDNADLVRHILRSINSVGSKRRKHRVKKQTKGRKMAMGVRARRLNLEATQHAIILKYVTGFIYHNVQINAKCTQPGQETRQEIFMQIDTNKAKAISQFFAELAIDLRKKK